MGDPQEAAALEYGLRMQLSSMTWQRFVVVHLASERGAALNGRRCIATGPNGRCVAVRMLDDNTTYSLKLCNLRPEAEATTYTPPHGPGVPEEELLRRLGDAADFNFRDHGDATTSGRDDIRARIAYVREHLAQGRVPPPVACGDPLMTPAAVEANTFVTALTAVRPCCCGDGNVDFRRFNTGLVGGGGDCDVCMEHLPPTQRAIGFPCGHAFHTNCAKPWLESHNTCPTCRFELSLPGMEYAFMLSQYERQLTLRVREYFISGFCERCQAQYMEANPLVVLPDPNGGPTRLIPRSQLP